MWWKCIVYARGNNYIILFWNKGRRYEEMFVKACVLVITVKMFTKVYIDNMNTVIRQYLRILFRKYSSKFLTRPLLWKTILMNFRKTAREGFSILFWPCWLSYLSYGIHRWIFYRNKLENITHCEFQTIFKLKIGNKFTKKNDKKII